MVSNRCTFTCALKNSGQDSLLEIDWFRSYSWSLRDNSTLQLLCFLGWVFLFSKWMFNNTSLLKGKLHTLCILTFGDVILLREILLILQWKHKCKALAYDSWLNTELWLFTYSTLTEIIHVLLHCADNEMHTQNGLEKCNWLLLVIEYKRRGDRSCHF